ncbi:MAG: flagellar basal body P-ring formation chaperone FlgA [Pseudomonadales bacterium]
MKAHAPLLLALAMLSAIATSAAHAEPPLAESLRAQVHAAVQAVYPDDQVEVDASIDPRLRLSPCNDLSVVPRGQARSGRMHVALRCGSPTVWSAYIPVRVKVMRKVLVAARPLLRDQRLSSDDVREETRDITTIGNVPVVPADALSGLAPRRPVAAGTILTLTMFATTPLVESKDVVTLSSQVGPVTIETRARSLADAGFGEQVWVENLTSGKKVAAWVTGPGRVATRPSP